MRFRIAILALGALLLASTAPAASLRLVDDFEGGANEGGWTGGFVFDGFGWGLGEFFIPEGGSHQSAYLFRFAEEFIPEMHTTPGLPTAWHGDWRAMGVQSFSADAKVFQYEDFLPEDHPLVVYEQPYTTRERHVTLMLTRDPDPGTWGDECTVVSVGGHHFTSGAANNYNAYVPSSRHGDRGMPPAHVNHEPRGEGWETFHFPVHAWKESLPGGWAVPRVDSDINGDGDPDYFDNACPGSDDEAWRYVTSQVDQVTLRFADPISEAFGIGQFFAYGLDEVTLVLGH